MCNIVQSWPNFLRVSNAIAVEEFDFDKFAVKELDESYCKTKFYLKENILTFFLSTAQGILCIPPVIYQQKYKDFLFQ
jgi:hypothetical protein